MTTLDTGIDEARLDGPVTATNFATVGIVDDTPDVRLVLRLSLERYQGVVVVGEAGDGVTGIELAREHRPDVLLLDLAMPRMDGLQALPLIRAASPDTRIIVLSGFETDRMAGPARAAGAHAYVRKGATPEQVLTAITEVLGRDEPPPRVRAARRSRAVTEQLQTTPDELNPPRRRATDDPSRDPHRLIARAAHELRNPAIALTMLAEELSANRDTLTADMVSRVVNAIVRQASIVDQVTTDLLTSSHARRGSLVVNPRPVPLLAALTDVVDSFEGGPRSMISVDCPADLVVHADKVRLDQMVTNLLTNAVKYGEPPIEVHARAHGGIAEIRVRDHGPGVPEWFRGQLFDEYARATPQHGVGTGIGLFVVRSIAQAQGGDAWYESRPHGAVFCVSVPVAPGV